MLRYRFFTNRAWLGDMHAVTQRLPTNTRGPPLIVPFPESTACLCTKSQTGQFTGVQSNHQHTQSRNSQAPNVHRNLLTTFVMHPFVLGKYREGRERRYECVVGNYRHVRVRCVIINSHSRTLHFHTILYYHEVYYGIGNPSTFHRSLQALDLRVRSLRM